ncbi:MAG: heavy metal-binding domain-containing protein [Methanobacteriaceae archaeon]|nr:heavy metal-binding domain-containing protein [Methanobacteriaceae archaeon]
MNLEDFENSILVSIIHKRWAIAAVLIGTLAGFISAVICVYGHLVIFGFNIMFIISPLIAGFVETYIARAKYGKSTGAISAILIFILINIYGWIFPKNPITLNLFTLGGLALMIQAAFPIFINFLIFVVFIGALSYIFGYIGNLISKLLEKLGKKKEVSGTKEPVPELKMEEILKLGVKPLTTTQVSGKKISKYLGVVEGEALLELQDDEEVSKFEKIQGKVGDDFLIDLENARNKALKDMIIAAKELGANTITEISINYSEIGGIKENMVLISLNGTAVVVED